MRIVLIAIAVAARGRQPRRWRRARSNAPPTRSSSTRSTWIRTPSAPSRTTRPTTCARQISDDDAGPLYIAILPASALDDADGSPEGALRELADQVGEPGVYAAVIGNSFRAGATAGRPAGRRGGRAGPPGLRSQARRRHRGRPVGLRRGASARRAGMRAARPASASRAAPGAGASGGGGKGWLLLGPDRRAGRPVRAVPPPPAAPGGGGAVRSRRAASPATT